MHLVKKRSFVLILSLLLWVGINYRNFEALSVWAGDIPIEGAIYNVYRSDGSSWTYIDIVVSQGFSGTLPGDIDSITVTGPNGDLPVGKDDFNYNKSLKDFWTALPGTPAIGSYTFKVRSGKSINTATDVLASVRTIPVPNAGTMRPAKGETLACRLPSFSWTAVEGGKPLYYLLEIRDAGDQNIYSSGYVKDMVSIRLPSDVLEAGHRYRWRVRAADGPDWIELNNRSQSPWLKFSVGLTQGDCDYSYRVPAVTDDGWETSSLSAEGVDPEKIREMVKDILKGKYEDIHSVLIVKNGKLILEEYFDGYTRNRGHVWASATKSISSILTGIAIDRKMIPGLDLKIHELFPEYRGTKWVDGKYDITLEDVLTMTSGLNWLTYTSGLPLTDPDNDDSGLYKSYDPIRYTLDKDLVDLPGSLFKYSTGISIILGEVIRKKSGMSVEEFSRKYLFGPLDITDYEWRIFPNGTVDTGGGFLTRPRDMAKIGYMMVKKGKWKNRRIVSEEWVEESTRQHIHQVGVGYTLAPGYGYQWHTGERKFNNQTIETFFASGLGGQYIFVIPGLDLVAVFNSKHPVSDGVFNGQWILGKYIVPAVLPTAAPPVESRLDPESIDQYPGEYSCENWPEKITLVKKDGKIYILDSDGEKGEVFHDTGDIFHVSSNAFGEIQIAFTRDDNGDVKGLVGMVGFMGLLFDKVK